MGDRPACDVCFHELDAGAHCPRILPCGHGLCETCCAEEVKKGEFACPLCGKKHRYASVTGGLPSFLPPLFAYFDSSADITKNFQLLSALSALSPPSAGAGAGGDVKAAAVSMCSCGEAPLAVYCPTCELDSCKECFGDYHRKGEKKSHQAGALLLCMPYLCILSSPSFTHSSSVRFVFFLSSLLLPSTPQNRLFISFGLGYAPSYFLLALLLSSSSTWMFFALLVRFRFKAHTGIPFPPRALLLQAIPLSAKPEADPRCTEHKERLSLWCDTCKVSERRLAFPLLPLIAACFLSSAHDLPGLQGGGQQTLWSSHQGGRRCRGIEPRRA